MIVLAIPPPHIRFSRCSLCISYNSHLLGTDTDFESEDAKEAVMAYQTCGRPGPILAVEVKDGKHGTTHVWSIDKLK